MKFVSKLLGAALAVALLTPSLTFAQATGGSTGAKVKASKTAPAANAPTDAQITDAKAKGMVWVNTSSKVYHKKDGQFYGKTKQGQFMTEADAQKAGYRAAKESAAGKKKTGSGDTKTKPKS